MSLARSLLQSAENLAVDVGRPSARLWLEDAIGALFFFALIAGLAWAPFWLGSNRALAWAVNALFFSGLALCYEIWLFVGGRPHPFALRRIWPSAFLFSFALIGIALQMMSPIPMDMAHPIWASAAADLQKPLAASLSVDRNATLIALLRLLTDASTFWLALQLCCRAGAAEVMAWAVSLIVAVYAAYGLVLTAFFSGAIPFFDEPPVPSFVRSTFVNRDHFATYAGLGLMATIGLILHLHNRSALVSARSGADSMRLWETFKSASSHERLLLILAAVIAVALAGSASRGGLLAALAGLSILSILTVLRRGRLAVEDLAPVLFGGCAVVVGIIYFGDVLAGRIASSGFGAGYRLALYRITIRSIAEGPWLGFGYGTFADVFPLYRDSSLPVAKQIWDKAHNSYLEIWQGLGLIFGSALIGSVLALVAKCYRGWMRRRRTVAPALIACAASALVGVHALVDFSLQIPAVSLTFMALLGAGVAQSESSRHTISDNV